MVTAEQVLLVEDSSAVRDFVSAMLEAVGDYEVVEVGNGFDALRALPRGNYAFIVSDVNMPDVNGIELTRFVRQSPRHKRTPIIIISTDAAHPDVQRALAAGANAFLPKPFTAEQFLATVASIRDAANRSVE